MFKILVADDHPMIRKRIRQILDEQPDLEVCAEASGGHEVLKQLSTVKPDLIILDINMPDLGGLETLAWIREHFPGLPVLMLTALSEGMYAIKAKKAGASGFISKELAGEELVTTIRNILIHPH
ncbi:MAG TPA: response regulator transcription factor [Bacteroidales bacterium]|nr:response regulator transcription factor [Bacteroidales bacterium]